MSNQEKEFDTWLLRQGDVSDESAQDIALAAFLSGWAAGQSAERDTLRNELEVARRTKLLAWMDGLTANLGIIKEESDKAFRLFVQANAAKRKNFVNWQSAAAENRRLVGMEQDAQHYKEEMEEAQADARALAEALNRFDGADTDELPFLTDDAMSVLQTHGAKYLE